MKQLLLAFQFLSIIPLRVKGDVSEREIAQSAAFFPIVGAIQGILLVVGYTLSINFFPTELTTGILLLLLVLSNGGFHLDGLSDTFDAIAAKSEDNMEIDRQKRLAIMKDSTIGPIGVIAIFLTLLLKFLALNTLSHLSLFTLRSSLFLMPILSKWAMVISIFHGRPARKDGLGRIFINSVRISTVIFSSFLVIFFYILAVAIQISFYKEIFLNPPIPPLVKGGEGGLILLFVTISALLYIFSLISVRFCRKKFGGLTGDTLGAISEITEILFLLMVLVWS
ncbi:MAG: adenosylcobinamide-GDP ribazoletransferase [Nitrospirota bacterium]